MMKSLEPIRTTLVGGVIFLIPVLIVGYVLAKAFGFLAKIVHPVLSLTGLTEFGHGATFMSVVTVLLMAVVAYGAGVFARTIRGQRFMKWIQGGIVQLIPSFH